jgi:hypothetical protein
MFKLDPDPTFKLTVEITRPGGSTRPLELEFKWLERQAFIDYCKTSGDMGDIAFFSGLIAGWDADAPFDAAALEKLFKLYPKAAREIFVAYRDELLGAEEKN